MPRHNLRILLFMWNLRLVRVTIQFNGTSTKVDTGADDCSKECDDTETNQETRPDTLWFTETCYSRELRVPIALPFLHRGDRRKSTHFGRLFLNKLIGDHDFISGRFEETVQLSFDLVCGHLVSLLILIII